MFVLEERSDMVIFLRGSSLKKWGFSDWGKITVKKPYQEKNYL